VKVIGIGPGHVDYLLPRAVREAGLCDVLVGSKRALRLFDLRGKEVREIGKNFGQLVEYIKEKRKESRVGVLVSGDPGFYSLLAYLLKHLTREDVEVTPGISSFQVAFSRLGIPWQEAKIVSLHGRPLDGLAGHLRDTGTIGILTDKNHSPCDLALLASRHGSWRISVCRNLTYPDESVRTLTAGQLAREKDLHNCVVVMEPDE
jgi:cobalt-precorrin-7 (C5)-methyltransferase